MKQIICDNLTLKYESKIIVENLSFSVEKGDYLCVVGENGSGKTTLIRTLLGLHAPAAGSLEFSDGLSRHYNRFFYRYRPSVIIVKFIFHFINARSYNKVFQC